jgi:putative endonuclease
MANLARTIYIGMTSNLESRIHQHKHKTLPGFTQRYGLNRLVYYEEHQYVHDAIAREKQLKGWLRSRKVALIESMNPDWCDLSEHWEGTDPSLRSG